MVRAVVDMVGDVRQAHRLRGVFDEKASCLAGSHMGMIPHDSGDERPPEPVARLAMDAVSKRSPDSEIAR